MMKQVFNTDFRDFIAALNQSGVEYLLVGGYAVILHGYTRTTGDLDIWVHPDKQNYRRLTDAFYTFGMPLFDMTQAKFLHSEEYDVFTFGRPPVCIDIITNIKGLSFKSAFDNAIWIQIDDSLSVRTLCIEDLIKAKRAAGRYKDLDDIENLTD